ncbi:MAG: hypothetical protein ACRDD1_09905 [Planctomycetia bacterium]
MRTNRLRAAAAIGFLGFVCGSVAAAEETAAWRETGFLAAPEAGQAAAAAGDFVYAITNDRVAKYNRRTGVRTAVSVGPAEHLNSGYFHDGRLYLAHSNFPKTPEQSEIFVLDVETMRLAPFHDFGDAAGTGSLTWALVHDGCWWCNFAKYGADNHRTTLIKFDAD